MKANTIDVVERLRREARTENLCENEEREALYTEAANVIEQLRAELAVKVVKRPQAVYFRADGTDLYGMEAHRAYHADMIASVEGGE